MAELTVAVVGCGPMGGVHLACWSVLTGVRIAAVCHADAALAAQTASQYSGTAAFAEVRDLLQGQTYDIVDVCTPAPQHFAVVEAALNAGANVLCEKPLATTSDQARALLERATQQNRLLMTAFCHRFHPPILFLKDLLDNDDLGRPTMFRCRFSGYWDEASQRTEEQAEGIGALLDTAVHGIDLFRYLIGEVVAVQGQTARINPELTAEDTVALVLRSESGALGVVEVSWTSPGGRNIVEVYGTAGACLVDYDANQVRFLTAEQPYWQTREEGGPNRFEREIAHFADVVRGIQAPLISPQDGLRAIEVCEQVMPSLP